MRAPLPRHWTWPRGRDLSVFMHNDRGTYSFTWAYRKSLFEQSTIERFAHQFQSFLGRTFEQPATPISRLELVCPSQRRQILRDWNDSGRIFLEAKSVPAMGEAQVARTPDRIAVVSENRQLTDRDTLLAHRAAWSFETAPHIADLANLTPEESSLYDDHRVDRFGRGVCFEQERIPLRLVEPQAWHSPPDQPEPLRSHQWR